MPNDDSKSELSKTLDRLPIGKDRAMGIGVRHFLSHLNPDDVKMDFRPNGFVLTVKTDRKHAKMAKEFWDNKVSDKLNGDS